jgi:hypothetical protein
VEQGVINKEAEKRLLASFINGLIGAVEKKFRMHMPENIDKALNMAIVATTAEREVKAKVRDDRGTSTKVIAVGGSREIIPENRYENRYERPGEIFNGAVVVAAGPRIVLDGHNTRPE